jgi:hypothetical protein
LRTPLECGIWWYENDNIIVQQWYTCICYFWKRVGLVQSGDSYQPIECYLFTPWYSWKVAHLGLKNKHSIATKQRFVFVVFFSFFVAVFFFFFLYGRRHDLVNGHWMSMSKMTTVMFLCRDHNRVIPSSFVTSHRIYYTTRRMDATGRAKTAYLSG